MVEVYGNLWYRGYSLEIELEQRESGKSSYSGRSQNNVLSHIYSLNYSQLSHLVDRFVFAVDKIEGAKEENEIYQQKTNCKLFEFLYQNSLLTIFENKEDRTYFAWADNKNFNSWNDTEYTSIIERFRQKVKTN